MEICSYSTNTFLLEHFVSNSFYPTNLLLCTLCRSWAGNIKPHWKLAPTGQCWLAMVNLDLNEKLPKSGQANVCQALQNIYGNLPTNQSKRGLYFSSIYLSLKIAIHYSDKKAQTDNTSSCGRLEPWNAIQWFMNSTTRVITKDRI